MSSKCNHPFFTTKTKTKEVCHECGEMEELYTYPRGRMCSPCQHGDKIRECDTCGDAFLPRETDTYTACADCWDKAETKPRGLAENIQEYLVSLPSGEHWKTAREIAKALGVDKHNVNQVLYAADWAMSQDSRVPTWTLTSRCLDEEEEEEEDGSEWFDDKYPNAACHRCSVKLTGKSVVYCGGGGGACETWYCADCHADGTEDCEVCKA